MCPFDLLKISLSKVNIKLSHIIWASIMHQIKVLLEEQDNILILCIVVKWWKLCIYLPLLELNSYPLRSVDWSIFKLYRLRMRNVRSFWRLFHIKNFNRFLRVAGKVPPRKIPPSPAKHPSGKVLPTENFPPENSHPKKLNVRILFFKC